MLGWGGEVEDTLHGAKEAISWKAAFSGGHALENCYA